VGDAPPPLWMAAHRPRVLCAAGRLADGWIPIFLHADEYGRALGTLRDASAAAGRPKDAVVAGLYAWVVVDEDRDAAERLLDSLLLRLVALTASADEYERAGAEHPLASRWGLLDFVPTDLTREEALSAAAAVPAEVLRSYYFWGTPDDVVDRLGGCRAAGLEHVDLVNVSALGHPAAAPTAAARTLEIMQGLRALP